MRPPVRPRCASRLFTAALSVAVLGAGLFAAPAVRAAEWTGLYLDPSPGEPPGASQFLTEPDTTFTVVETNAARSVIGIQAGAWTIRLEHRDGVALTVGSYGAISTTGLHGYHGLVVTGPDGACTTEWGRFEIREIAWSGSTITKIAVDVAQRCEDRDGLLAASLHLRSTLPIKALAIDPLHTHLGETIVGSPLPDATVNATSIGHAAVTLGDVNLDGDAGAFEIVDDDCSGQSLPPGDSCAIVVRHRPVRPAVDNTTLVLMQDDTAQGSHFARLETTTRAPTTVTLSFDPDRAWAPGLTAVQATVEPSPGDGNVVFRYDDGVGTSGEITRSVYPTGSHWAQVAVPRGTYTWSATFEGYHAYLPSESDAVVHRTGIQTTTALVAAQEPTPQGTASRLRATVKSPVPGPLPAGVVTFRNASGNVVGTRTVGGGNGEAILDVAGLAIGNHRFEASYVSTEDGQPSMGALHHAVTTPGIQRAWEATPPPATGSVALQHVDATASAVFVSGTTQGTLSGQSSKGGVDVVLARYHPSGLLVWARQLGTEWYDAAGPVVVTGNAVYVSGTFGGLSADGAPSTQIHKFDLSGNLLWSRSEPRPGNEHFEVDLAGLPDGGVVVAMTGVQTDDGRPMIVRRYRSDGSIAWEDRITGVTGEHGYGFADGISADAAGIQAIGVRWSVMSNGSASWFVRRYSLEGAVVWTHDIVSMHGDLSLLDVETSGGRGWVAGTSTVPITDTPNWFPRPNPFIRNVAANGAESWTRVMPAHRLDVESCGFATLGRSQPAEDALVLPGFAIAGWTSAGSARWRWEAPGRADRYTDGTDIAVVSGRAYVLENVTIVDGPPITVERIVAFDGLPVADCSAPSGTVTIAGGAAYTKSTAVTITTAATDDVSGMSQVALSNDGTTWTTRPYAASQPWTLPTANGTRTVHVKWKDVAGNWSAVKTDTIVLDTVAPSATAPRRGFVAGTAISSGRISLRVPWSGADATSGIARYELGQSTDGGAWTTISTTLTAPTATRLLAPLHTYRFRARAIDKAGNTGAWATGATFRISRYSEFNSAIRYSGSWTNVSSPAYWGGAAKKSSTAGAKASLTFTGRSIAWVARTGPDRGKAQIYINGTHLVTVDLYSATAQAQRVVWVGSWTTAVSRKVTIRVAGTSGRPRIDLDALVTAN